VSSSSRFIDSQLNNLEVRQTQKKSLNKSEFINMEVLSSNQSFNGSFYDYDDVDDDNENNEHEKTFVTVHVDSFNEKDFTNFLNCLDTFRESTKKRKSRGGEKVIKNYCVRVPDDELNVTKALDISESESNGAFDDKFEKKCDEMKHNISQMFSYFDEDVQLNFDEIDEVKRPVKTKVKSESCPVIKGVVRKRNAPSPSVLHKNQVDKIMNEFNRVKINYYSKDNHVEFTNIDYFYCDSDIDSVEEKVGKLNHHMLEKFRPNDDGAMRRKLKDIEVVPKNSVRDKIDMFSKLDFMPPTKQTLSPLTKCNSEPIPTSTNPMIRNTSCANKNKNKCFIKDVNNSLSDEQNLPEFHRRLLTRVQKDGKLSENCCGELMTLEHILNRFGMSLLFTLNGLLSDNAFALGGQQMTFLALNTQPSLTKFNETFASHKISECNTKNVELSVVDVNQIQLQMLINFVDCETKSMREMRLNVVFMAAYGCESDVEGYLRMPFDATEDTFYVYFTSFFEVTRVYASEGEFFNLKINLYGSKNIS
jgi:hypothetical protein